MNNRELAIKIVEDLCNKFDVELGGVAVIAVQNILESENAAQPTLAPDVAECVCVEPLDHPYDDKYCGACGKRRR